MEKFTNAHILSLDHYDIEFLILKCAMRQELIIQKQDERVLLNQNWCANAYKYLSILGKVWVCNTKEKTCGNTAGQAEVKVEKVIYMMAYVLTQLHCWWLQS